MARAGDAGPARAHRAEESSAATSASSHGAYVELLGAGGLYSVNYEYRISAWALRAGYSWWEFCLFSGCSSINVIPLSITTLTGSGGHHLELGGGVSLVPGGDYAYLIVPEIGYRYMAPQGGLLFRAMFTPLIAPEGVGWSSVPFGGLSFGAAF